MKHFASSTRFASFFALVLVSACGAPAAPAGDDGDDDPKFGDTGDDGRPNADGDEGAGDSEGTETNASQGSSSSGDGDAGDGDGDGGDGDTSSGDGDGDGGDGETSSGDGDTSDTGDGDTGAPDCFGPTELPTDTDPWDQPEDPTAIGSTWPYWEAEDFQPLSCLFGETYSPNAFLGRVTVFVNWRATCSYCQAQASKFEELRVELKLMGHEVYFVGLNQVGYGAPEYQEMLSELVSFNLMQGTSDHDLWALGNNQKDDIFIYDETGHLVDYIYALGEITTNMNTPEGYDNVKNAVLTALGESP